MILVILVNEVFLLSVPVQLDSSFAVSSHFSLWGSKAPGLNDG